MSLFPYTFKQSSLYFIQTRKTRWSIGVDLGPLKSVNQWVDHWAAAQALSFFLKPYRSPVVDSNEGDFIDRSTNFFGDASNRRLRCVDEFSVKFQQLASFCWVVVDQVLHQLGSRAAFPLLHLQKSNPSVLLPFRLFVSLNCFVPLPALSFFGLNCSIF